MKNQHVRKYFLDWLEPKLNTNKVEMIDQHLQSCTECKEYYDKMQIIFSKPELSNLPTLQPDAFLPTKIKELAKQKGSEYQFYNFLKSKYRVTLGTVMIICALMIGIFLGKWMSNKESVSETEIVLSYSTMFSDEGIGQVWNNIVAEGNGENQ